MFENLVKHDDHHHHYHRLDPWNYTGPLVPRTDNTHYHEPSPDFDHEKDNPVYGPPCREDHHDDDCTCWTCDAAADDAED